MSIPYCTRDEVLAALDVAETARVAAQVDRLVLAASRSVDQLTHRRWWPERATRYVDWPDAQYGTSYRLWLVETTECVSLDSVTSGGATLSGWLLRPDTGPPYTRLEIDLSGSASFGGGNTHQRAVALTGVFGACADTTAAATLTAGVDASATTLAVSDSSTVGVGSLLLLGAEYVQVTRRTLRTTGQTLTAAVAAQKGTTALPVADTAGITPGETVTVDSERMLITDIAGSTLIVERAWSGSTLAAHTAGATVYAPRTLTVERAQCGTTAANHNSGATVYRHTPPPLVQQLTIAETLVALARENSGYARTVGSGDATRPATGGDLADLRKQVYRAHGRKARTAAV